jgi:hypothetical protein
VAESASFDSQAVAGRSDQQSSWQLDRSAHKNLNELFALLKRKFRDRPRKILLALKIALPIKLGTDAVRLKRPTAGTHASRRTCQI